MPLHLCNICYMEPKSEKSEKMKWRGGGTEKARHCSILHHMYLLFYICELNSNVCDGKSFHFTSKKYLNSGMYIVHSSTAFRIHSTEFYRERRDGVKLALLYLASTQLNSIFHLFFGAIHPFYTVWMWTNGFVYATAVATYIPLWLMRCKLWAVETKSTACYGGTVCLSIQ